MNKFISIITILATIGIFWVILEKAPRKEPAVPDSTDVTQSSEEQTLVTAQVENFGKVLKEFSLLAPKETLERDMDKYYGPFVSPALLAEWKADPSKAIGRSVSSPWPESIGVVLAEKQSNGSYKVEANVIEVTSANNPAAVYPLHLVLEKINGSWLISSAEKGAYSELPQRVSMDGVWECLPHANTTGAQTTECAFGILKDGSDLHYGVDMSLLASQPANFASGDHVHAEGVVTPANQLSANQWQKYDMEGILSVTSISKINQ